MLTIGADIEVFVRDMQTDKLQSAIDYIEGTKYDPQATPNGAIQHDNILAEFNVVPGRTESEFHVRVSSALDDLRKHLTNQGMYTSIKSSEEAPLDILKHPEAQRFGCESDTCVWNLAVEHKVDALQIGNLRTAGGHVHLGWANEEEVTPRRQIATVKMCDFMLGLPSVLYDSDARRRQYYGQAGHFRTKPYGIEYRVLSNFWIESGSIIKWVFRQAYNSYYNSDDFLKGITQKDIASMRRAINTSDKKLAELLIKKFGIEVS